MQKACKDFFCGLDVYELYRNHRIVYGRITHHIIPIREDWERRFDVDNLIYLSDQSHHEVHARMDAGDRAVIEELREYRKRWIEAQGVSKKF